MRKGRSWSKALVVLATIAILAGVMGWGLSQAADESMADKAKAAVSQAQGIGADQLTVVRNALLGDTDIMRYKLKDSEGNIYGVALDSKGRALSDEEVEKAARKVDNRGFVGKLEKGLADRLERQPEGPVNVIYWLKGTVDEPLRGDRVSNEEHEANLRKIKGQIAAIQKPVSDKLRARGQKVLYQAHYAPLVAASVDAKHIRALAAQDNVERVYLERVNIPRLDVSRQVVQANIVNGRGITGFGRRVGVVESGQIAAHVNLPAAQRILVGPAAAVSGHKTNVAGVIQSTHATWRGMAPSITIIDGRGTSFADAQMMAATDACINAGAVAVNMSFGSETNGVFNAFARYVDRTVYNTGKSIVVAVSNVCANRMGSPEIAFNCLAVGAFGDMNTTAFAGDVPACTGVVSFSAYQDPFSTHGDREEPDVVAPGHQITTTNSAGGFTAVNGTSFAAPHVTGAVGLLNHRRSTLSNKAEEVRAIVMAAARHNIEGASRLSERDGAGAIMNAAADQIELQTQSMFMTTPGGLGNFPISASFSATVGQKVRCVVAWAHKTPGGDALTQPTTDLDLTVLNPAGVAIASSLSFDNNYEIVEFIAPANGVYTARITNFRSSVGNEYIGIAWSKFDS